MANAQMIMSRSIRRPNINEQHTLKAFSHQGFCPEDDARLGVLLVSGVGAGRGTVSGMLGLEGCAGVSNLLRGSRLAHCMIMGQLENISDLRAKFERT